VNDGFNGMWMEVAVICFKGTIPTLAYWDWEKPRNTSVTTADNQTENRIVNLSNSKRECWFHHVWLPVGETDKTLKHFMITDLRAEIRTLSVTRRYSRVNVHMVMKCTKLHKGWIINGADLVGLRR